MIKSDNNSVESELSDIYPQSTVRRSDFADLDGLLVNSENFNAVFVQRNNKQWLRKMLGRLSTSPSHLQKLTEILVNNIVKERHPEWTRRSMKWLTEIVSEPQLMEVVHKCRSSLLSLISYETQLSGVGRLIDSVSETAMKGLKTQPSSESSSRPVLLDNGYVFFDDSDDNFGIPPKRSHLIEPLSMQNIPIEADKFSSGESDSEVSLAYDSDVPDDEEDMYADSADDGVFDVEDETSISDTQAAINDLGRSISSRHPNAEHNSESSNYCSSPDIEVSGESDSNCDPDSLVETEDES